MQIAILLLASGQFALRAKTSPDNPEQQIRELEEKVNGAYAANDLPAYFSYYASDFAQWLPGARRRLKDHLPALFAGSEKESSVVRGSLTP